MRWFLMTFASFALASSVCGAVSDFNKIRVQYVEHILGNPSEKKVAKYQRELSPDGTWPDINYLDKRRSPWEPGRHNARILEMAKCYRLPGGSLSGNKDLREAILRALNHWLASDYVCPNWWSNDIGVPGDAADILILMDDAMPKDVADLVIKKVLSRSKISMTGQNLVWLAEINFVRSLYERDEAGIKRARDAILGELRVTIQEGIQPDWSFHQHGPQLQIGNYGGAFSSSMAKWGTILRGTSQAFNAEQLAVFRNYITQGADWFMWKQRMDFSACGRQIFADCQIQKGHGSLSVLRSLAKIDPVNLKLYEGRLADNSATNRYFLAGNKHFWRSDIMVQRRPAWYASVRMSSERVIGAETCNLENMLGMHMGDGMLLLYLTGDEFKNIQPVWDWHRLPGTTCDQSISSLEPSKKKCMLPTGFVGGVSDGLNGVAVLDYRRDKLSAGKSWFFFKDRIICLGAGIESGKGGPILTSVQQSLLAGPVVGDKGIVSAGSRPLSAGGWVHHAGIGYHIIKADKPVLQIASQTGDWKRIFNARNDSEKISSDVFSIWLDHGTMPKGQSYAYGIYPEATPSDMRRLSQGAGMQILSNTPALQAVALVDGARTCIGAVFYKPGVLEYGKGLKLEADTPCLVTMDTSRKTIFVSEPTQKMKKLILKVSEKPINVKLPDGWNAGKSIEVRYM